MKTFGRFFLLFLAIVLIDTLFKWWIAANLPLSTNFFFPYGGIAIFHNVLGIDFALVHEINQGAAWGLFAQFQPYLMTLRIGLITALLGYLFFFNKDPRATLPFTLILAGAVGNVVDFFFYGHVIDMFQFVFWGYHYPVFNLADASIFIGVALLGIQMLHSKKRCPKPKKATR